MSGDHDFSAAFHDELFARSAFDSPPEQEQPEDLWSADAPPLPFMAPDFGAAGSPASRINGALPWIKRAG